jgi:hypothetical protein
MIWIVVLLAVFGTLGVFYVKTTTIKETSNFLSLIRSGGKAFFRRSDFVEDLRMLTAVGLLAILGIVLVVVCFPLASRTDTVTVGTLMGFSAGSLVGIVWNLISSRRIRRKSLICYSILTTVALACGIFLLVNKLLN